jgi:hypothetical protein
MAVFGPIAFGQIRNINESFRQLEQDHHRLIAAKSGRAKPTAPGQAPSVFHKSET